MSSRIKGITVEIGGNTTKLQQSLKGVDTSLRQTQTSLKDVNRLLKLDPTNVELLKQKHDLLTKSINSSKEKEEKLKQALSSMNTKGFEKMTAKLKPMEEELVKTQQRSTELRDKLKQLEKSGRVNTDEYKKAQAELDKTKEHASNLKTKIKETKDEFGNPVSPDSYKAVQRELIETQQKTKSLKEELKRTPAANGFNEAGAKVSELGTKITNAGKAASIASAAIVAVGTASLKAFSEVDNGMDNIIKKTGESGKALKEMQNITKDIATTMPASFDEAGKAVGEVATRFDLSGRALKGVSEYFIKFAKLNDTDVSPAIDATQKAMAAFGMKTEEVKLFLDAMNAASQKSGISFNTLSTDLIKNASSFREMGANAYQSAKFLASVEKSGADVDTVMAGMTKAVVNATAKGKTLPQALKEVQDKMRNAKTSTQGLQAAMEIFGKKAGPAVYTAIKNGTLSFDALTSKADKTAGSVKNTFDAMKDGIDNAQPAMNALKLAGSELGNSISQTLGPMLLKLAEMLKGLADWLNGLDPSIKNVIVVIGMIVVAIGPLLLIIGALAGPISTAIGLMGTIAGAVASFATPIGIAIAAIVAIIAIFKNWGAISKWFGSLFDYLGKGISSIWNGVGNIISSISLGIVSFFTKTIPDGIRNFIGFFAKLPGQVGDIVGVLANKVVNGLKSLPGKVWNAISSIPSKIASAFDFKLPSFKLPHLKITGGFSLIPPNVPKFDVKWYKEGGLFNSATIAGIGEAGQEYALPLNRKSLEPLADQLNGFGNDAQMNIMINLLQRLLDKNTDVYMDKEKVGSTIAPEISKILGGEF